MYSSQLLSHFEHPRNVGEIDPADASVEVQNPACGDILCLTMSLHKNRIAEIRFRAQGCVPTMACGSCVTELLQCKTVDEARNLRREDIVRAVGGLPQASIHASQLAMDALAGLLKQIKA